MFVLVAAVTVLINVGWRAAGLPGQKTSTAWQFFSFTVLITGATLAVIGLGLTYHRSAAELEGERGMRSQRSGTDEAVDRRRKP